MRSLTTAVTGLVLLAACSQSVTEESAPGVDTTDVTETAAAVTFEGPAAPDFTLTDSEGNSHALASYLADGKTVVLEWFNPECPVVKGFHNNGAMLATYNDVAADDVVWLAINSGGKGKQGHGVDKQNAARTNWNLPYAVLIDEDGTVGRAYEATNTPHMFVIKDGVIVYRGAIDDSKSAKAGENFVVSACAAVREGRQPETADVKAFGCGVKYAD